MVSVCLHFAPNEFFSNSKLEYTLRFEDTSEEQIEAVIGTEIMWKDKRKNVTHKRVRKTQRHRDTGVMRTVYCYKQTPSFFNVFTS